MSTHNRSLVLGFSVSLLSLTGCSSSNESEQGAASTSASCPIVVADADCDKTQRPFVFVHGTYGSGDNIEHVAALFGSNGYCQDRFVGLEYNSVAFLLGSSSSPGSDGTLDALIDKVRAETGFDQVDLAGHSQGTAHCGTYLSDATRAAKVAHYINFSGSPNVGDIPTLSLSSQHDLGSTTHHAVGSNVTQVTFDDQDHFAVAASTQSFVEVWKYLHGGSEPQYTTLQCGEDPVTIEGIAETFADNVPVNGHVEIREVGTTPRGEAAPVQTLSGDPTGHFGPIKLKRNVQYEFKGFDEQGNLVGYVYPTPFKRSNRLLRLLKPSDNSLVAAASTDHVTISPHYVALVTRWAGGGFRQDLGASMKIDGNEVLTADNAGLGVLTGQTAGGVVGFFLNDANDNGQSDLGLYASGPFLAFTDVFMDASTPKFIDVSLTPGSEDPNVKDTKVKFSNWGSTQILLFIE